MKGCNIFYLNNDRFHVGEISIHLNEDAMHLRGKRRERQRRQNAFSALFAVEEGVGSQMGCGFREEKEPLFRGPRREDGTQRTGVSGGNSCGQGFEDV